MSQEIYNEGRVVGLSAWEIFANALKGKCVPDVDIPTESQWLTSMIGSGMSMILKIPKDTTAGIHDFPLPEGSVLAASGVVLANPFLGNCSWDHSDLSHWAWATKVESYSPLIPNTSNSHPSSSTVPTGTYSPTEYSAMVEEFVKITDGVVFLSSAKWEDAPDATPAKDINPDYDNSSAVIRLYLSAKLNADVLIIFTGFQNKRILQAFAGYATSEGCGSTDINTNDWANGGMLGPEVTPWATKIIFSVPSAAHTTVNPVARVLPSDDEYTEKTVGGITFKNRNYEVKTNSVLDFSSINLTDYFNVHSSEFSGINTIEENVTSAPTGSADDFSTLTALYPGMTAAKISAATDASSIFPPALYAAQFSTNGTKTLVPVDTAAPGTIKGFETSTQATNYLDQMPDNYAIYHNSTAGTYSFAEKDEPDSTKWTGTAVVEYLTAPKAKITAGNTSAGFIALTNSAGVEYKTTGKTGQTYNTPIDVGPSRDLVWDDLLSALVNNRPIGVLGDWLRTIGTELTSTTTSGGTRHAIGLTDNYHIDYVASKWVLLNPGTSSDSDWTASNSIWVTSELVEEATGVTTRYLKLNFPTSPASIQLGTDFIKFGNGLKLFISTSEPSTAGVEPGSIGIGW